MEAQIGHSSLMPKGFHMKVIKRDDHNEITGHLDVWASDRGNLRELVEDLLLDILKEDDEQAYSYVSDALDVCQREQFREDE